MEKESIDNIREILFKQKIGLDSSVIIDLIDNKELFFYREQEIFSNKGLFVTHKRCIKEVKDWLIEKRGYEENKALEDINNFLKEHNIKLIEADLSNKSLLTRMKRECAERNIEFHPPDSWIIADFKKQGVKKVYSTNNHFLEACKLFNITACKFPTVEREVESQLREMFKKRYSKKRK